MIDTMNIIIQGENILKIAILGSAASVHTVKIVNGLHERGHTVVLFSLPNHRDNEDAILDGVRVVYLKYSGAKGYYLNCFNLKRILLNEDFDILNAHYASGYGTLARLVKFTPLVISVWGSDVLLFPFQSKLNNKIIKKNLYATNAIFSTSNIMAQKTKLLSDKEIFVTPFGVNTDLFSPKQKAHSVEIVIGYIKSISKTYGTKYLIEAFSELIGKTQFPIKLEIYGAGDQLDEMRNLVTELGIDKNVTFHGHIPNNQVPASLNTFDIFCAPSVNESFGVSTIEAMSCGIPCITSDADGLAEIMVDGETGFVVDRCNATALCEKMLVLINDKDLKNAMGESARKHVLEYYDISENIKTIEKYFEMIIRNVGLDKLNETK